MRGHPKGKRSTPCRHCDMVDSYRSCRAAEVMLHSAGLWRDEDHWNGMINFKRWLQSYSYEVAT